MKILKATAISLLTLGAAQAAQAEGSLVTQWLEGKVSPPKIEVKYDGKPIIARFNSFNSPQSPIAQVELKTFERLAEETGGKLVVRPFWNNSLANAAEGGFESISSGVADFGSCYSFMNPGGFTLQLGLQMPFMIENSTAGSRAAHEIYAEFLREKYEARGVYLARIAMTPPNQLVASGAPVKTVADLSGKRIWAVGDIPTQVASAVGASAVPLAPSELYTSFQTGIVDIVPMHDAGTLNFRLVEIGKHRTKANLSANATEFCMNPKFFDGLPEDLKAIFYRWMQLANHAEAELYFDAVAAKGMEAMKEKGFEFHDFSEAETKVLQDKLSPITATWTAKMKSGAEDGEAFLTAYRGNFEAFNAKGFDKIFEEAMTNPVPNLVSSYTYKP